MFNWIIKFIFIACISTYSLDWSFPRDHGIHPDFDTEWYYMTGHLTDQNNTLHGFQLTFFRHKLTPVHNSNSPWNSDQLFTGHFAFTNGDTQTFSHDETFARTSFNLATANATEMDIRIDDWQLNMTGSTLNATIQSAIGEFTLHVANAKEMVFHGKNGVSKKSPSNDHFSYYYSMTRLIGHGELKTADKTYTFTNAQAWLDREIFNQLLDQNQIGWDWFAIQLDDGRDIMAFRVRSENNDHYYSGTIVDKLGNSVSIGKEDLQLTPVTYWESDGRRYPIEWRVTLPGINEDLTLKARQQNQELHTTIPFPIHYWEGQALVTGSSTGKAYMELVGY
ncbi:MAG: lipocalin-like domain-containing protein [Candidatus Marinamargulisbacteria bacterium]